MADRGSAAPDTSVAAVPAGKIRCYVNPCVLRRDTPEEHVRQRVARSLVEEYGYSVSDLEIEFSVKLGSKRKGVDIAIFNSGSAHSQETIEIIVETKRDDVRPNDAQEGVEQLKSYMAACINAHWGLWVGSEMQAFEKNLDPKTAPRSPFLDGTDIPLAGDRQPRRLQFIDLVPATEGLSGVFKRCHNYLHVNGNLSKERAFFEFLKLIFCKVHDEQTTSGEMRFSITPEERRSDLGQRKLKERVGELFREVRARYPYIFPLAGEPIELDNRSLAYIVGELQKYNFQETATDIKGEAYEEIVSVTSRRDQGAFFTPRNICDMAARMVLALFPKEGKLGIRVLDPACGTGGFLRSALIQLRGLIIEQVESKWGVGHPKAEQEVAERLRRVCDAQLFGIDKLPELAQAAQMNLAMHGDGSSNVFHTNSLLPPGEWPIEEPNNVRSNIQMGGFDVVFTNPPFGSKLPIDDPHILEQFQLRTTEAQSPRTSMPPEQLFVERCLTFLRPGGRMAIVLPDSILSNPGLAFIRRWLIHNAYVLASVDLPREAFARSDTHTNTSVLVLQRFSEQEARRAREEAGLPQYEAFMAIADAVGWDLRGQTIFMRNELGEEIVQEVTRLMTLRDPAKGPVALARVVAQPVVADDLPTIAALFEEWVATQRDAPWAR